MLDYEFTVEQMADRLWVLTICPPFGDSIILPGAFRTKQAALAAVARNRSRWSEDQSSHGFRVIDGGQDGSNGRRPDAARSVSGSLRP